MCHLVYYNQKGLHSSFEFVPVQIQVNLAKHSLFYKCTIKWRCFTVAHGSRSLGPASDLRYVAGFPGSVLAQSLWLLRRLGE